ncbi:MAG: 3-methyl-2-oxobutanoate hydroxymethyltransferase, partial [Phycisphaerales bacterium]|nr:3-methyl-2-oxobutanoate hydroxymethyltransferase [Phycisphaerales bacterium]
MPPTPRITLQTLRELKRRHEPIAMLTVYDYPTAKILADTGIDILLVGDSAATTMLGADSTQKITFEFLLTITEAVRRGAPNLFLMADMPFASYPDIRTAVANAARFIREAGADAVKLEADHRHRDIITAMAAAGITVCAHVGLLPQRAMQQGGHFAQGRTPSDANRIIEDAVTLANAGAHLLLIEAVPDEVTAKIVQQVPIPVLGCGAGPSADGHVLVLHDILGYTATPPRFVQQFADIPPVIAAAATQYAQAVRSRTYPAP